MPYCLFILTFKRELGLSSKYGDTASSKPTWESEKYGSGMIR